MGFFGFELFTIVLAAFLTAIVRTKIPGWIIFGIGIILTVVSLVGLEKSVSPFGFKRNYADYWVWLIAVTAVGAVIMTKLEKIKAPTNYSGADNDVLEHKLNDGE